MKTLKVRCIVDGNAEGEAMYSSQPIAFLKGVDPEKGMVCDEKHDLYGKSFAGKILVFPNAVGSSVGAYVIYRMSRNKMAPAAIVNQSADIITASGCAIAAIPLFDAKGFDISELRNKKISLNGNKSELRIE